MVYPFHFKTVAPNLFVISFACLEDKNRVMNGRPWLFDSYLFNLKPFNGHIQPSRMDFTTESFWVQMHNLPLDCMNEKFGHLGSPFGKSQTVMLMKMEKDGGRTINFLRIKMWVPLTYEKLPKLWFPCGKIFHEPGGVKKLVQN